MALTPSTMPDLGTKAIEFNLADTGGKRIGLNTYPSAKGYLICFICNHCPYVKHLRKELAELTATYMEKGIATLAINSNDVENYPEDSPSKMLIEKKSAGYFFPYLFDETQEVAKAYGAACTPDFFLYDSNKSLVYRGQFDDSRPGNNIPVTGKDLKLAMDTLLAGGAPLSTQKPSIGCNIKWKTK